MAEPYGWDVIEACEELYILDGLTFEQVAERSGVAMATLKRWSAESQPSWPERRREYRQAQVSVRRGVMLAKAKLIGSVLKTEDPQKAYAFASLVNTGKTIEEEARERSAVLQPVNIGDAVEAAVDLSDPKEMAAALKQAVNSKMIQMLSQPGALTIAGIKELQQALGLLEKLRGQGESNEAGKAAPSAETIREWHEMLGL